MAAASFIAQSFRSDGRGLVACRPQRFNTAEEAIASARRAAERKPGAVAYSILEDDAGDRMARSILLFRAGRLPGDLEQFAG